MHKGSSYGSGGVDSGLEENMIGDTKYKVVFGKEANPRTQSTSRTVEFTAADFDQAKDKVKGLQQAGEWVKSLSVVDSESNDAMSAKAVQAKQDMDKSTMQEAGRQKQEADTEAAHELVLYAENDGDLYRQSALPIIANLQRKVKSGKYDHELAIKLWRYHADRAAKKYNKEHGGEFSPATRDLAAKEFRDGYDEEVQGISEDVNEDNTDNFVKGQLTSELRQSMKNRSNQDDGLDENLDELDRSTLKSYVKKASSSSDERSAVNLSSRGGYDYGGADKNDTTSGVKDFEKSQKRSRGMETAVIKLIPTLGSDQKALNKRSYLQKATSMYDDRSAPNLASKGAYDLAQSGGDSNAGEKEDKKAFQRSKGIERAINKLPENNKVTEMNITEGKLKQLKDKFVDLKVKAKDTKDPKVKAQFEKIRDQIKAEEKKLKDEFIKLKQSKEITPAIKAKMQKVRDQLNESSYGHSLEDAILSVFKD
jgi:hypothetical protein